MLRCAASFVIAAYHKYASFLRICTPCLRTFYEVVKNLTFYEDIIFDMALFSIIEGSIIHPHRTLEGNIWPYL